MKPISLRRQWSPINRRFNQIRRRFGSGAVILMYHWIAEMTGDPLRLCVPTGQFTQQLEILHHEYEPVPLRELLSRLHAGRPSRRMVALTFDDGYADNLFAAAPLLEQYQMPATVFITTGYLDGRREFWWDDLARLVMQSKTDPASWRMVVAGTSMAWDADTSREKVYRDLHQALRNVEDGFRESVLVDLSGRSKISRNVRPTHRPLTGEECRTLARSGLVEIGAHTVHHPWLSAHRPEQQKQEFTNSCRELESILGSSVTSLAYPYGKRDSVGPETIQFAHEAGLQVACANVRGQAFVASDPLWLPRFIPGVLEGDPFRSRIQVPRNYGNSLAAAGELRGL
jgi:peptidoglycan/xylan/chitin deacetylase (PgdA/CDA1 family)